MTWIEKLKNRWKLDSGFQVAIVLVVFACTGFTVMFLKTPVKAYFISDGEASTWFNVCYWILIFPVYNVILLFYGLLLGQFSFFWKFEKRMFRRLIGKKKDV